MRIGIDIDGVLNDMECYYRECGQLFCWENNLNYTADYTQYRLRDIYGWEEPVLQQFYYRYSSHFFMSNRYARPLAAQAVKQLSQQHEIYIITARPQSLVRYLPAAPGGTVAAVTAQWLADNEIPYHHLFFTCEEKQAVLQEHEITLMVEDNPRFLQMAAHNSALCVFCMDTGYNRQCSGPNITRVYGWQEIVHRISQMINQEAEHELHTDYYHACGPGYGPRI